ncbi:hypothetical protein C2W62_13565 [Candidatus Entotheonella serta]|nr:hypothetical protein C2W62_13565 [Candidatus Entotheonella serta]
MKEHVLHSLYEAKAALDNLLSNATAIEAITIAGDALVDAFRHGHRVFSCGNGGAMCDAMHFAEELSGRYRLDRRGLPAVAGDRCAADVSRHPGLRGPVALIRPDRLLESRAPQIPRWRRSRM